MPCPQTLPPSSRQGWDVLVAHSPSGGDILGGRQGCSLLINPGQPPMAATVPLGPRLQSSVPGHWYHRQ